MNQITPIPMANLTKWNVASFRIRDEDTVPGIDATVIIWGAGNVPYAQFTLTARGGTDGTADRLVDSTGYYTGRWKQEMAVSIPTAYAALLAAYNSSTNLGQQKQTISQAMYAQGMIPASLAPVA